MRDGRYTTLSDVNRRRAGFWPPLSHTVGSPLYYIAFCGFYDLEERLIMKFPEQVSARGGRILASLLAACTRHFRVRNLLHMRGAFVNMTRGEEDRVPQHMALFSAHVGIMRWLLNHGAEANARDVVGFTPLHWAVHFMRSETIQVLLEYKADVNSQNNAGATPLNHVISIRDSSSEVVDLVRRLPEHGSDPNICNDGHSTPFTSSLVQGVSRSRSPATQLRSDSK